MKVEVLNVCKSELRKFPNGIIVDLLDAIAKLKVGEVLSMPLSRKMTTIGNQAYELRLSDKNGVYRVIYFIKKRDGIYLIHAFTKKAQKTPKRNINLAIKRIKEIL